MDLGRIFKSFYCKFDEKYQKIEPGDLWNSKKTGRDGQDQLEWLHKWPMWAQWGLCGGPMMSQEGLGLQIRDPDPGRTGRAWPPYARFIRLFTIY